MFSYVNVRKTLLIFIYLYCIYISLIFNFLLILFDFILKNIISNFSHFYFLNMVYHLFENQFLSNLFISNFIYYNIVIQLSSFCRTPIKNFWFVLENQRRAN